MYCKNKRINQYIADKCNEMNVKVDISDKITNCAAVNYYYKEKYYVIVNGMILEKKRIFAILHELSHIELKFIGRKFEKRASNSITEKIVNLNMIKKNKKIILNKNLLLLMLYAIISESLLEKKIVFGERECID